MNFFSYIIFMPELPEVETIRRGLLSHLKGQLIESLEATTVRIFRSDTRLWNPLLSGQRIHTIRRRGKFLIFDLDRYHWVFHLGMTGQMTLRDPSRLDHEGFHRHPTTGLERTRQHAPDKHTHLIVRLEDGRALLFRDVRKFGRVYLFEKDSTHLSSFLSRLGMEPLHPDYRLERFLAGLAGRTLRIKSLLLDQSFVAGVGNIYADEALFVAGIHPARRISMLRRYEKEWLFLAIPKVLEDGIFFGGTTLRDYLNSDGEVGSNQDELYVYGRSHQPCRLCQTPVDKIVISQRGTHFCPQCQPRRPPARRQRRGPLLLSDGWISSQDNNLSPDDYLRG